jgi:lauroyl/myristoyl acyltransferase
MLYFLYRLEIFIVTHLSLRNAYRFARCYAMMWYWVDSSRKKIIRKHMAMLLKFRENTMNTPVLTHHELDRLVFTNLLEFSNYLVEIFRISIVDKDYLDSHVTYDHFEEFDHIISEGKGVIIYTPHFGNWELAGVALHHRGYQLTTIALPQKEAKLEALFHQWRSQHGMDAILLGPDSAKGCIRALRKGKILALIADEDYAGNGIELDFLGEKDIYPIGPAILSRITGAPVVPGIFIRQPDHTFILRLKKAVYPIKTDNAEQDIETLTLSYLNSHKPELLQYPEQWFRFR